MEILSVKNLRKSYGQTQAVSGVSFDVAPGEVVGLLGPNGAGKTSIINMVLGVLAPDDGTVTIQGLDIARRRQEALQLANFAAVYAPLPGNLTVEQNLRVFAMLYDVPDSGLRIRELVRQFGLEQFLRVKSGALSSGEQTRLCLAKALLNNPRLLLLDEPTASLDPSVSKDIRQHIRAFVREEHGGVLWTSHNMYEVAEVCDRVLFLSHGKVLLSGDPKTLPGEHGKKSLEELFITVAREPLSLEVV